MARYKGLSEYSASMDFDPQVFKDMRDVAESTGGTLSLTDKGRVIVVLPGPTAVRAAAVLTNDDFPHGYVEPGDDSTLVFAF